MSRNDWELVGAIALMTAPGLVLAYVLTCHVWGIDA